MILLSKQTDRSMKQNNSPKTEPCKFSQLIFDKGTKQCNGKIVFEQVVLEELTSTCKTEKKKDTSLTCYTKINSKWIQELNM